MLPLVLCCFCSLFDFAYKVWDQTKNKKKFVITKLYLEVVRGFGGNVHRSNAGRFWDFSDQSKVVVSLVILKFYWWN